MNNMKIKQIAVRFGRTWNLGNYESQRLEIETTADLEPHEDPNLVTELLLKFVKDKVYGETPEEDD